MEEKSGLWSTVVKKRDWFEGKEKEQKSVKIDICTESPVKNYVKKSSIAPAFNGSVTIKSIIDRVTVKMTHFNNKEFKGFVSREDARHQIFQALGLDLSLHHGTVFKRQDDDGQLLITFKLNKEINKEELHFSEFWYLKTSKAGKDDMISGEVVYPIMGDLLRTETSFQDKPKAQKTNIKQLRVDGCDYNLTEKQIRHWIDLFGKIEGEFVEEAEEDKEDGTISGTGAYLVPVKFDKKIPNIIPMFGQKVVLSHEGISRICKTCYKYHKNEISCVKRDWHSYVEDFKLDYPRIPGFIIDGDADFEDSWLLKTETKDGMDKEMEQTEVEDTTGTKSEMGYNEEDDEDDEDQESDESELDEESDYELSPSDLEEFERLSQSKLFREHEIEKMLKQRRKEKLRAE